MPQSAFRFPNALKKVFPDHRNRFSIAKVRAMIEVLKLGP